MPTRREPLEYVRCANEACVSLLAVRDPEPGDAIGAADTCPICKRRAGFSPKDAAWAHDGRTATEFVLPHGVSPQRAGGDSTAVDRAVAQFTRRILHDLEGYRPAVRRLGPRARRGGVNGGPEIGLMLQLHGLVRNSDEMDRAREAAAAIARETFRGLTAFRLMTVSASDCRASDVGGGDEIHG